MREANSFVIITQDSNSNQTPTESPPSLHSLNESSTHQPSQHQQHLRIPFYLKGNAWHTIKYFGHFFQTLKQAKSGRALKLKSSCHLITKCDLILLISIICSILEHFAPPFTRGTPQHYVNFFMRSTATSTVHTGPTPSLYAESGILLSTTTIHWTSAEFLSISVYNYLFTRVFVFNIPPNSTKTSTVLFHKFNSDNTTTDR